MRVLFIYLMFFVVDVMCESEILERRLRNKLLNNYNKNVRPVINDSVTTFVDILFFPDYILELNQETETLSVDASLFMEWKDDHLVWIPSENNNISDIDLDSDDIWTPDIFLFYNTERNEMDERKNVFVQNNGYVGCYVLLMSEVPCVSNYKFYPFDTHSCSFEFGSWTHGSNTVHLIVSENNYEAHEIPLTGGEWKLVEFHQKTEVIYAAEEGYGYSYHTANFTLVIKRKASIYQLIWIMPLTASAVIILGCFWLELWSTSRHGVGLVNFVMMAVNLLCLVNKLPGGSVVPVLAQITATGVSMAGIFVLETAILCSAATKTSSPPEILRTFAKSIPDVMLCAINDEGVSSTEPQKDVTKVTEWRKMSIIYDRLFFYIFSFVYLILVIYIFVV